ncbi:MAG: GNAT family N-acetyltransferase [Bacteroidota bacterium]|jgi:GNAT superfamily N-acetyltransferase
MAVESRIVLLRDAHDRDKFDCGESSLNTFLRQYALQHMRKNMSRTWVLTDGESVLAYSTLCMGELRRDDLPESEKRKLPHHPIPVLRLARLATDLMHRRKGYATHMLVDALQKTVLLSTTVGLHAVEVHALNSTAQQFYLAFGFHPLTDNPHHLYLPLATIAEAFDIPTPLCPTSDRKGVKGKG